MGQVFSCDVCETPTKEIVCSQVVVSKKGKEIKTLDACPSCTKLIIAGGFIYKHKTAKTSKLPNTQDDEILKESISPSKFKPSTENSFLKDENDLLIESKMKGENANVANGILNIPSKADNQRTLGGKLEIISPAETNKDKDGIERCPHYNKRRGGDVNNPYFKCTDCGQKLFFKDWEASK